MAVVGAFLVGCVVLMVAGCAGVRSGAPQEEQGHTEVTKNQAHSERCEGTRGIVLMGGGYETNDLPGCPKGGLLLGTDGPNTGIDSPIQDYLYGGDGDDEVRGLGANDEIYGGYGSDVIYGGPGFDMMFAGPARGHDRSKNMLYGGDGTDDMFGADGEDVLYGGDGNDWVSGDEGEDILYGEEGNDDVSGDYGEDVLYGGDGNDTLTAASYKGDLGADKVYCGAGTDKYTAGSLDYVSNSCEVKQKPRKPKRSEDCCDL
jgi:RTX calcium-binding nonapeptide repeat (4 copies)